MTRFAAFRFLYETEVDRQTVKFVFVQSTYMVFDYFCPAYMRKSMCSASTSVSTSG